MVTLVVVHLEAGGEAFHAQVKVRTLSAPNPEHVRDVLFTSVTVVLDATVPSWRRW